MANLVPTSYIGDLGNNTWLRHGGSTLNGVLSDVDDATWVFGGGSNSVYSGSFGTASNGFSSVDARTLWANIKMRRIAVPDTGFATSYIQMYITNHVGTKCLVTFDPAALLNPTPSGGDMVWYSAHPAQDWADTGTADTIDLYFNGGIGNAAEIDIAEISFGNVKEGSSTVTVTSGSHITTNKEGANTVAPSADLTITITPDSGYQLSDLTVDSVSIGATAIAQARTDGFYVLQTVVANHTVALTSELIVFTPSGDASGTNKNGQSTAGSGAATFTFSDTSVVVGDTITVTVTPYVGTTITDIIVDGVSIKNNVNPDTGLAYHFGWVPDAPCAFPYEVPGTGPDIAATTASLPTGSMNSYFFMPPGSTVGIIDDGNFYQGMGHKPLKKKT